jgi:MFS transporter, OFA family, oxalate/formate antiporter
MNKPFYGWWVLLGLCMMYFASNGIGLNTLPLFFPEMAKEFGWDPAKATLPSSLLYLTIAIMSPFIGQLLDRFDARKVIILGTIGVVAALLMFAKITDFNQLLLFYVAFPLMLSMMGIITSMYVIRQWFDKKLGLAIGLFLNSSSLGGAVFAPWAGSIIKAQGWQTAALYISIVGAVCMLLPLLWIKIRPSDVGQLPDGEAAVKAVERHTVTNLEEPRGVTFKQAMRFPGFWLLTVVTGVLWFCITGFLSSQGFYYKDLKLDPAQAGQISGVYFGFAVVGKIVFGYLSDRLDKKKVMLFAVVTLLLGVLAMKMSLSNVSWMYGFAVLYGIGYSAAFTMIQILVAEYYRGRAYGSILGVVSMIDTLAGFAGVIVLGTLRKNNGDFHTAFNMMMLLCAAAAVATFFVKKPTST